VVLSWFRSRARALAALVFVSLAAFGASTLKPHEDDCHDSACLSTFVVHDAAAHSWQGAASHDDDHPLHCVVCHWIRSFKPALAVTQFLAPSTADAPRVHARFVAAPPSFPAAQPPLRSPPHTSPFDVS
jgi:hypothetical protein